MTFRRKIDTVSRRLPRATGVLIAALLSLSSLRAEEHEHHHERAKPKIRPPKVYLDKSPRIVAYQLKRLDNERLLLVERKTDHARYAPIFEAIAKRGGMSLQHREEALRGLVKIRKSEVTAEILLLLGTLDDESPQDVRTAGALASVLLGQPEALLDSREAKFQQYTRGETHLQRAVAHAGLIAGGNEPSGFPETGVGDEEMLRDWLAGYSMVRSEKTRAKLRPRVTALLGHPGSVEVRRAATVALRSLSSDRARTFRDLAPLIGDLEIRSAVVKTLLTVPVKDREPSLCRELVATLVASAEETPAARRTTDSFLDALELADSSLARLPVTESRAFRARLREVAVRVVRIRTVEEEMRYDLPYFAVEAGRPVQIVLRNEDLMPHNLVITQPEALREVAELGARIGPSGHDGKPYVPNSPKVLWATRMVQPDQQERLTLTAPEEPGEYPFVCTFPRHWVRMYGVMVVVEDLEAWLQDPRPPKDPIGSQRAFVRSWKLEDLAPEIDRGLAGRGQEIGQRLFAEATCNQCHRVGEKSEGGTVGPNLAGVLARLEGDRKALLREILEPSHRIDPQYALRLFVTTQGRTVTGIVTAEDRKTISVLENPESPKPLVLRRSDIAQSVDTEKSMMPKALLDRFTRDEIFEILAYILAAKGS